MDEIHDNLNILISQDHNDRYTFQIYKQIIGIQIIKK